MKKTNKGKKKKNPLYFYFSLLIVTLDFWELRSISIKYDLISKSLVVIILGP